MINGQAPADGRAVPAAAEPAVIAAEPARTVRPAFVPADLSALHGPRHGVVELPVRLCWSEDDRTFDLDDRDDRVLAYEYVLEAGSLADICGYLDAELLAAVWPELMMEKAKASAWEAVHPMLRRRRLAAAA